MHILIALSRLNGNMKWGGNLIQCDRKVNREMLGVQRLRQEGSRETQNFHFKNVIHIEYSNEIELLTVLNYYPKQIYVGFIMLLNLNYYLCRRISS